MKTTKLLTSILCLISITAYASPIVYLDQAKVQATSKVLQGENTQINNNYNQMISKLKEEERDLEKQIQQTPNPDNKLSIKALEINQKLALINNEKSEKLNDVQSRYLTIEKTVVNNLRISQKYEYVLNASSLIAADDRNDISATVTALTDKEYIVKYRHKQ